MAGDIISLRNPDRLAEELERLHTDDQWAEFAAGQPLNTDVFVARGIDIALRAADAGAMVNSETGAFVDGDGSPKPLLALELGGRFIGLSASPEPRIVQEEAPDGDSVLWVAA